MKGIKINVEDALLFFVATKMCAQTSEDDDVLAYCDAKVGCRGCVFGRVRGDEVTNKDELKQWVAEHHEELFG